MVFASTFSGLLLAKFDVTPAIWVATVSLKLLLS